ncbi:MAG TPA: PepSY domain-containing protein [Planctomycetaceae bacterium]|nr:PepSY domain-containing protein [Planctomycetaceae bacterium]
MYRVIWRWHFYAGMIIAPALIVVAATGAIYIFKDELEAVIYPGVTYVEPTAERTSYEQQLAVVRAAVPAKDRIVLLQVFTNPRRATSMVLNGGTPQYDYVDPYRGHYLGAIDSQNGFFNTILKIHRTLFLGTTGRIVVELATCWSIVLAVTGIYLWWPHTLSQLWGVWLPRLRQKPYVVLRDLHTVSGVYVVIVAIVILLTGLTYTSVWGSVFQYAGQKTEAYDMFTKSMVCKSPLDAKDLPIDRIIEIAQKRMPDNNLTVWFPRIPNGVYLVTANNDRGPQVNEMLFIDRSTGEILEDRCISQTKLIYQLGSWNYSLHVGSVWGLPTKVLWLVTCVILMTLPVTGIWMWWQRRPMGRLGLPRQVDATRPRWLVVTVTATSVLLPVVGLSVIVLLAGEQLAARLRKG